MAKRSDAGRADGDRVTILDVARAAQVSRQTVSNALNFPERLQPDTLERVRAQVERLGYQPSQAARSLRSRRAGAVGVEIAPPGTRPPSDVAYPFLAELSLAAGSHSCHIVTFGSRTRTDPLRPYRKMVRQRLVDAFIIADTHHGDPRPAWLAEHGIPFASYGRIWDDPGITGWSDVDGGSGCEVAVRHLHDQGYGTGPGQQLAFLGWPTGSLVGDDRREGWHRAVLAAGLQPGATERSEQNLDAAIAAATRLIKDLAPGSAVVCASDLLAVGVWQAATRAGRRIGPDLGIVGFDDSPAARTFGLTSIAQPLHEIADRLLDLVHHQLDGGAPPARGALLLPHLVRRASTEPTAP